MGREAAASRREGLEEGNRECPSTAPAGRAGPLCVHRGRRPGSRQVCNSCPLPPPGAASCPGSCSGQIHTLVSKDANSCQGKQDLFLTEIFVGESSTDNYSRLHFLFTLLCLTHTHTHTHIPHTDESHTHPHTPHTDESCAKLSESQRRENKQMPPRRLNTGIVSIKTVKTKEGVGKGRDVKEQG